MIGSLFARRLPFLLEGLPAKTDHRELKDVGTVKRSCSMKRLLAPLLALGLLMSVSSALAAEPQVGEEAPAFRFVDGEGKEYTLDDFKDKDGVVVAWFPKAFTPG
jgi:hypothetical protein